MSESDGSTSRAIRWQELPGALALLAIAAFFFIGALDLPFGSLRRLGPGYVPLILSIVLAGMAVMLILGEPERLSGERFQLRPVLAVFSAIVVFALTVTELGLLPSVFLATVISATADRQTKPLAILILGIVCTALIWLIFAYALGLPIPAVRFGS